MSKIKNQKFRIRNQPKSRIRIRKKIISGFTRTTTLYFSLLCRDRPSGDAYVVKILEKFHLGIRNQLKSRIRIRNNYSGSTQHCISLWFAGTGPAVTRTWNWRQETTRSWPSCRTERTWATGNINSILIRNLLAGQIWIRQNFSGSETGADLFDQIISLKSVLRVIKLEKHIQIHCPLYLWFYFPLGSFFVSFHRIAKVPTRVRFSDFLLA